MGCAYSARVYASPVSSAKPKNRDPFVTELASPREISSIREAIKKNDKFLLQRALAGQKVQENLGSPSADYTCLHYAAECNAYTVVQELLTLIQKDEYRFHDIVNVQDSNRQTPAMIAVINDHHLVFHELLKYDAVDYILRNKKEKTIMDLLTTAPNCNRIFTEFSKQARKHVPIRFVRSNSKKSDTMQTLSTLTSQQSIRKSSESKLDYILSRLNSESKIYSVLRKCSDSKEVYRDLVFQADVTSITKDPNHSKYQLFKKAVWRRPHEIFKTGYDQISIFEDLKPSNIIPGLIGMSYLLSCISAMAEYPSRVMDIFINKETTKYGAYALKFYVQGIPTEIVVDDYFPCHPERQEKRECPLFLASREEELWAMLLEKAWGKLFGQLTAGETGDQSWAMEYLLGVPSITHQTSKYNDDELFKILKLADKNNWIISASVVKGPEGQKNEKGLVHGHSYSLLGVYQIEKHRVLKLRNAWGVGGWTGEFGENSEIWTEDLKKFLSWPYDSKSGIFYIPLEDFKGNFESFSITYYHNSWSYTYEEVESDSRHATYYEFEVDETVKAYFRVHQHDPKFLKDTSLTYQCSPVEFSVCRIQENGQLVDLVPDWKERDPIAAQGHHTVSLTRDKRCVELTPGKYLVRTKVRWVNDEKDRFILSAYSSKKIEMRVSEYHKKKYHIMRCLGMAHKESKKHFFEEDCYSKNEWVDENYCYLYIKNDSERKLNVQGNLKNPQNIKLKKCDSVNGEFSFKFVLEPRAEDIVVVKRVDTSKRVHVNFVWDQNFA